MTLDEIRNEHIKHLASWMNTLATAIMTAGTLIPASQFIFKLLPPTTDSDLVYGVGVSCIGAGILLHLYGHWMLRSLR